MDSRLRTVAPIEKLRFERSSMSSDAPGTESAIQPGVSCDNCGHEQFGSQSAVCVECGLPRGVLRFSNAPAGYLARLSHVLRHLCWTRLGLCIATLALAVALVTEPAYLALSLWWASRAGWLSIPAHYVLIADSLERTAMQCAWLALAVSLPMYWIGLLRLGDAVRIDSPLRRAARLAAVTSLAATGLAATLVSVEPASASRVVVFGFESVGCVFLAAQLWALVRVRVILARRAARREPSSWRSTAILLALAVALSAILSDAGDRLLSPLMILVFLLGLLRELNKVRVIGQGLGMRPLKTLPRSRRAILVVFSVAALAMAMLNWFWAVLLRSGSEPGFPTLIALVFGGFERRTLDGSEVRASGWPRQPINGRIEWPPPETGEEIVYTVAGIEISRSVRTYTLIPPDESTDPKNAREQISFAQTIGSSGWPVPSLEFYSESTPTADHRSERVLWGNVLLTSLATGALFASLAASRVAFAERRRPRRGECRACGCPLAGLSRCRECGQS